MLLLNAGRAWGGIESHSVTLGRALRERGHGVVLACYPGGFVEKAAEAVGLATSPLVLVNSGDPRGLVQIVRAARRCRAQVVVANLGREYWPAAVAARLCGLPVVFVRHQTDRIRRSTRWLMRGHVERIVAVSSAVKEALLLSGIPAGKVTVIHNSISFARFDAGGVGREDARRELGIGPAEPVIGAVGKLHRGKGIYELLHAAASLAPRHPGLRLLYVGDGPERQELEAEARRTGMGNRVIFTGVRKDVERLYAAMDVFVLPSTCDEAFGMVLIEAMAMGRPVVGTMVGGIPDIITDGIDGLLVPPGDEAALTSALARCLEDRPFAEGLAAAGMKTAHERFSDTIMAERFEKLLQEVSEETRS